MALEQVEGALLITIVCPLLGGLPLIDWIAYALTGNRLSRLGTGNVSVSAAFYHCGTLSGILAVISEAAKGILAVLLARYFFPSEPIWELISLMALVMGRYWIGKGAGTTNVVWGIIVHDPIAAMLIFLISGISFTIFRERRSGRLVVLVVMAVVLMMRQVENREYILAAIILSGLIAWIYQKIPDDLELPSEDVQPDSQTMFSFFRGDKNIISLNDRLVATKVGQKAANLARLKSWGYPVPEGWILLPGEDPESLIRYLKPSREKPLIVRSSAIGEDSELASAAGQYQTILNITNSESLRSAIFDCQASYYYDAAIEYRRQRQQPDTSMAVLIQKQIRGVFSGVAFSRDPIDRFHDSVSIEALPGDTTEVVSGKNTPQQYRVSFLEEGSIVKVRGNQNSKQFSWDFLRSKDIVDESIAIEGDGNIPQPLIAAVASLARSIEELDNGIPQDIEWTFDGKQLWLLQARSITTLYPIWTRKIAAEVIPGTIRPLTWSINQPLTCGVWGEIFQIVLGKSSQNLDFNQTATLHYSRAYFNATLLGEIFLRMGLPSESLEFLTRGAKFTQPPWQSTLKNSPGLWRLLNREWNLETDFYLDKLKIFDPILEQLKKPESISPPEILEAIEMILLALKKATYYSILVPLSLAVRKAIFKVDERELDSSQIPEIESLRSLAHLAADTRKLLATEAITLNSSASLFAHIAENPDGESILEQFDRWLERYGYLSQTATDISVPRWRENPRPVREMFSQLFFDREANQKVRFDRSNSSRNWKIQLVQKRLNLKGKVTEIYEQLLAHLRWSFLALEQHWLTSGLLQEKEDVFFLEVSEIRSLIRNLDSEIRAELPQLIDQRRWQWQQHLEIKNLPYIMYGSPSEHVIVNNKNHIISTQKLAGIGASSGRIEGIVKIITNFSEATSIDRQTILVVPYTDAGWSPILSRAGGIIAEVGGRLSHGAIVAREYNIPAVMNVHNASQILQNDQRVRIDGQTGIVEIL